MPNLWTILKNRCSDKQILTTIPEAITELRRVVLPGKVWVLGTRTDAGVGLSKMVLRYLVWFDRGA
ncbi:unknown protein [Microcystis aeruginosa NIES-843]|uniref:Uncharacterized protein n=1 Tax=Microcystis aeruginosa (strain NIES-843 / IAM M-2473) TaxID=449447 RepID=B0JVY4_MICAN|nr:unknown protein [Microcystis aeruginosa NIES-843]